MTMVESNISVKVVHYRSKDMDSSDKELLNYGLGNVTWWGYSPSFNILENKALEPESGKPVLFSIIGSLGCYLIKILSANL